MRTDRLDRNAELLHAVIVDRHPLMATVRRGRVAAEAIGYPVRSAPETCRRCGVTMVMLETEPGRWGWQEIGPCFGTPTNPAVRFIPHSQDRCAEHRSGRAALTAAVPTTAPDSDGGGAASW